MEPATGKRDSMESTRTFPLNRRTFLQIAAAAGAGALLPGCKKEAIPVSSTVSAPSSSANTTMAQFPEKTNLILLTDRPPQLETPLSYFKQDFTPNDAFFVRWHLSMIPTAVDLGVFRLGVEGHVEQPLKFSLDDLRAKFEPVSMVAVNQCSGNSRRFFDPRVFGGQWGHGAMGNAKWTGVRLRDLLNQAKVKDGAQDVAFRGLDRPAMATVPAFEKSLAFDHCMDGEVMIAYEMNGAPLPMLNGFPLRLIVPGWFGTYWVKALEQITVTPQKFAGYWMEKAYRVPDTPGINEAPLALAAKTVPINRMLVRSIFVTPAADEKLTVGSDYPLEGLALDGGSGIKLVELTTDGGNTWFAAQLDPELGKYSWRRWRFNWKPTGRGSQRIMVRATNNAGQTQPATQWNRGGYARNAIEQVKVTVA
jgi:sulfite dehydrogenase (cytochrome) subunit A